VLKVGIEVVRLTRCALICHRNNKSKIRQMGS